MNALVRGWTGFGPVISESGVVVTMSATRGTFSTRCASAASGAARRARAAIVAVRRVSVICSSSSTRERREKPTPEG